MHFADIKGLIFQNRFISVWRWFFSWLGKESRATLLLASIIGLFIGISDLVILWTFKDIFSEDGNRLNIYITITLVILNTFIRVFGSKFTFKSAAKLTTIASQKIYNSTLDMNFEDFDKQNSSFYLTRLAYVGVMGDNLILSLVNITSLLGGALVVIIGALYLTGIRGFLSLLITIIGYYIVNIFTRISTKKSKEIAKQKSKEIVIHTQESILKGKEIRIQESENYYKNKYKEIDSILRYSSAINCSANSITKFSVEGIGIIIISILIQISKGEGIQTVVVMGLTFIRILPSIQGLFTLINNTLFYSYTFSGLKELVQINNNSNNQFYWITKENDPSYILKFDNVLYKYDGNKEWEGLKISFKIKSSSAIVITGESGEGKSTLLDLISCLRKPKSGDIRVNEKYVRNIGNNLFRIDYSYLGQSDKLYDCSILENIIENSKNYNEDRLKKIISICSLDYLLKEREKGLYAEVGEFGKEFSGGQAQRILLARTIYKKSKIVILDEFTSALDSKNTNKIIKNLTKFIKDEDRVMIVASHNQDIINYFDENWIISKGKLIISN